MVKLESNLLEKLIGIVHRGDVRCILGPKIGEDASIIDVRGIPYIVVHTDPITGSTSLAGWLSVVVPSNDVAVQGGDPRWISTCILLPEKYPEDGIEKIFRQINDACNMLNIDIVGGHTEYCPGIDRPIIVSTCIGTSIRPISTANAKPGDLLLAIRSVAIEASMIVVTDFAERVLGSVDSEVIDRVKNYYKELSVVQIAREITPYVDSMHDPTEGGIIQGVFEISKASKTCIELWKSEIPIREDVKKVLNIVNLDPLKSLSSGCLLAVVNEKNVDQVVEIVKRYVPEDEIKIIGRVIDYVENPHVRVLDRQGGDTIYIVDRDIPDEIMLLFSRK